MTPAEPGVAAEDRAGTLRRGESQDQIWSTDRSAESFPIKTYHRRWYLLAVYSLLNFLQCCVWNAFGPVTAAALLAFPNWNNTIISSLANMGPLAYVVFVVPYCWLLNARGARPAMLVMAAGVAAGTAVRCVSSDPAAFTATAFIGAVLNGVAGIMAMAAPPYISELWFPPEQRTTATGLPNIFIQLGGSCSFLVGPLLVRQPADTGHDPGAARHDIMSLMYVEAAAAAALLVAVLAYFPSRPPLPPSASGGAPAGSFWHGLRQAARAPDLPWVVGVYVVGGGVQAAYFGVLNINVSEVGVTEDQAGWLGFWAGISCCTAALVTVRLTDLFRGHMKATIAALMLGGAVCYVWQLALVAAWLPFSMAQLYCSTLLAVSCVFSTSPLLYEYAVELCHPVRADVIGAIMSVSFNVTTAVPLLLFLIKSLSERTLWLNYTLAVSMVISAAMLLKTDEVYRRTAVDTAVDTARPDCGAEDDRAAITEGSVCGSLEHQQKHCDSPTMVL